MAQFQCQCLHQDRWQRILNIRLIFRRITWSDSKDSKYRNCNSTCSLSIIIFGEENKIQNTGLKWLGFSVGSFVMDPRSGGCWFLGWAANPHDQYMEKIFLILRCSTRRLPRLWTRSSRMPSSKRRSVSRNRKLKKKRTGFCEGRQIAFMICD